VTEIGNLPLGNWERQAKMLGPGVGKVSLTAMEPRCSIASVCWQQASVMLLIKHTLCLLSAAASGTHLLLLLVTKKGWSGKVRRAMDMISVFWGFKNYS